MDFGSDLLKATAELTTRLSGATSGRPRMASAAGSDRKGGAAGWKTSRSCWRWQATRLPSPFPRRHQPDVRQSIAVPANGEHPPFPSARASICSWHASLKWRPPIRTTSYRLPLRESERDNYLSDDVTISCGRGGRACQWITDNIVPDGQERMYR